MSTLKILPSMLVPLLGACSSTQPLSNCSHQPTGWLSGHLPSSCSAPSGTTSYPPSLGGRCGPGCLAMYLQAQFPMVMHLHALACPTGMAKCSMAPKGNPWNQGSGDPPNSTWQTIPSWDVKCLLTSLWTTPLVSVSGPCYQYAHTVSAK